MQRPLVALDVAAGRATIGDQVVTVRPVPGGGLQVNGRLLRPLTFGERWHALDATPAGEIGRTVLAYADASDADDGYSDETAQVLALHLAGARPDRNTPAFADAVARLAASGWAPKQVWDSDADFIDLLTALADDGASAPRGDPLDVGEGWTSIVFAGASASAATQRDSLTVADVLRALEEDLARRVAPPVIEEGDADMDAGTAAGALAIGGSQRAATAYGAGAGAHRDAFAGTEHPLKNGAASRADNAAATTTASEHQPRDASDPGLSPGRLSPGPTERTAFSAFPESNQPWPTGRDSSTAATGHAGEPSRPTRPNTPPAESSAAWLSQPIASTTGPTSPRRPSPEGLRIGSLPSQGTSVSRARTRTTDAVVVDTATERVGPAAAPASAAPHGAGPDVQDLAVALADALERECDLRGLAR